MIQCLDQNLPKTSILCALQLLEVSWNDVNKAAVTYYFRKAKISRENQIDAVADNNDHFQALQEDIHELRQYNQELASEEWTAKDVVDTDSNVITTDAPMTDIEILESENLEEENKIDEEDGIKILDEPVVKPNSTEVRNSLKTLQHLHVLFVSNSVFHLSLRLLREYINFRIKVAKKFLTR